MSREEFETVVCNFPVKNGQSYKRCGKPIKDGACILECSHILCKEHTQDWFSNHDCCPVCKLMDGNEARVRMKVLSFPEAEPLLIGRTPGDLQRSITPALQFWFDQKFEEHAAKSKEKQDLQDSIARLLSTGRRRVAEVETKRAMLLRGRDELAQQLESAKQQLSGKRQEIERLEERRHKVQRYYEDLVAKAAGVTPRRPMMSGPVRLRPASPASGPSRLPPSGHRAASPGIPGAGDSRSTRVSPRSLGRW